MASKTLYVGKTSATPLGDLWIAVTDDGLASVSWMREEGEFTAFLTRRFRQPVEHNPKRTAYAASQLREYLAGERRQFTIPIDWSLLRPFQREALLATFAIPYGQTSTYGELAARIGRPRAARAVGRAEATNPMPLVIPCHRVIGADGKLTGYGGGEGLATKKWLLKMEGAVLA
ncbi:MAG: methylated-DNA--[protein]-cysteine S-methyltransferase [Chloroflexi bacterium]|nr:methylated-DNA--[protein]-cysteine S-methyltransferase [Chloroflexota bacterium]